jgi:ABC-type transport system involved in multi-copper enzyme maturation permease subunit
MSAAFLDPLTAKELSGYSRRWQTYLGRVLYVGIIGFILFQFWTDMHRSGRALHVSEYAKLGRDLFNRFLPFQLAFLTLAAISAAADQVTKEARGGTLGLLVLTPLSLRQIALGKWKAALAQAATLLLCGLPVLSICLYLGGVGFWEVAWSFSVTAAMGALGAAFSLRYSATQPTAARAVMMAIAALVVYTLLPLALLFMAGPIGLFVTPFLHPLYAAYAAAVEQGGKAYEFGWIFATPISFVVAWAFVRSAAREIERRAGGLMGPASTDFIPGTPYARASVPGSRARAIRGEVWEDHPLLWKELATRAASRVAPDVKQLFLIYFILFIVTCWFISHRSLGMFCFLASIFLVLVLLMGSSLFVYEMEGRKLDMLLAAPVSSWDIVRTKLLAGLIAPEGVRVLALWLAVVVGWSFWSGPGILVYAVASSLFLGFAYVLAAASSLRARTMHGAFISAAGILLGVLAILPFVLTTLAGPRGLSAGTEGLLSMANPVWLIGMLAEEGPREPATRAIAAISLLPGYVLVYGGATLCLVAGMVRGFNRFTGRG